MRKKFTLNIRSRSSTFQFGPQSIPSSVIKEIKNMDSYDLLLECCRLWATYPCNLQRPSRRKYSLETLHTQLKESKARLFDSDHENICFIEPSEGVKSNASSVTSSSLLTTYRIQRRSHRMPF